MPTGWSHPQRWTRSHERLIAAFERLHAACAKRGITGPSALGSWLDRTFKVKRARDLTVAQARCARRRLNAWRACLEGYVALPPAGVTATATATGHWWKGIPGMRRKAARRARSIMTGEAAA